MGEERQRVRKKEATVTVSIVVSIDVPLSDHLTAPLEVSVADPSSMTCIHYILSIMTRVINKLQFPSNLVYPFLICVT